MKSKIDKCNNEKTFDEARYTDQWYVINTHSQQESRTELNFKAWQLETFLPMARYRRQSYYNVKLPFVIKPLFPGYLFAKFDANLMIHKVRFTRGVRSVVSFGEIPAVVNEEIINIIKSRISADGLVDLNEELVCGDKVIIEKGLFRKFEGIFVENLTDSERIKILLNTIDYQAHILIDRQYVRKT